MLSNPIGVNKQRGRINVAGLPFGSLFPTAVFWTGRCPCDLCSFLPIFSWCWDQRKHRITRICNTEFPNQKADLKTTSSKKPSRLSNAKPLSTTIGRAMRSPKQHNPHKVMLHFRDSMSSTFKKAQCLEYDSNSSLLLLCSWIELNSKPKTFNETRNTNKVHRNHYGHKPPAIAKPLNDSIGRAMRLPKQHNPHKVKFHFGDSMPSTTKKSQYEHHHSNSSPMLLCSQTELGNLQKNQSTTKSLL